MRTIIGACALWWTVSVGAGTAPLQADMDARIDAINADLVTVRRDIHRHPEISGQEERTAGIVAARLKTLGYDVRSGVGGHGVVALLRGGTAGPIVAFRADMDAVRSDFPDPVDYRSEIPGVRHICGHDVHTTIGLAIADAFAAVRDRLPGSVMLIFQPAEETGAGAKAMLADGLFDAVLPAAIYAYHTAPMEVGQLVTSPGMLMTPRHLVDVRVAGDGDTGAASAAIMRELEAVSTLTTEHAVQPVADPDFILVQTQLIDGGPRVWVGVTTATDAAETRAMEEITKRLKAMTFPGVTIDQSIERRWVAGVTNDPALVARATVVAERILGAGSVQPLPGLTPAFSEDFGSFQERVPGVMFFLGVSNQAKGMIGMPHTPDYVADDAAIAVGAKVMTAIMLDRMAND